MAFVLAFVGDMPQQQANSGMNSQNARRGCRFCSIENVERAMLGFDTTTHGRYHHEAMRMRNFIATMPVAAQSAYSTSTGLHVDAAIPRLAPALDIVLSRPSDPAHSELGGLTMLAYQLFMETILETQARPSYNKMLRAFPFPPGWSHIPNPLHHLNSLENSRWSIIFLVLLRLWLRPSHVKQLYLTAREGYLKTSCKNQVFLGVLRG